MSKFPRQVAHARTLEVRWAGAARQEKEHPIFTLIFNMINVLGNKENIISYFT
jgi:hypothetical protein